MQPYDGSQVFVSCHDGTMLHNIAIIHHLWLQCEVELGHRLSVQSVQGDLHHYEGRTKTDPVMQWKKTPKCWWDIKLINVHGIIISSSLESACDFDSRFTVDWHVCSLRCKASGKVLSYLECPLTHASCPLWKTDSVVPYLWRLVHELAEYGVRWGEDTALSEMDMEVHLWFNYTNLPLVI